MYHEPKSDITYNLFICPTKYTFSVLAVSLRGRKKSISMIVSGMKCLWNSLTTNSIIKRKHTQPYECNICSNKIKYSIAAGLYYATHAAEVTFFMP